jgi:hypothetical protein
MKYIQKGMVKDGVLTSSHRCQVEIFDDSVVMKKASSDTTALRRILLDAISAV